MDNIWQFFIGSVILGAIVGFPLYLYLSSRREIRDRQRGGRDSIGSVWDIIVATGGGALVTVLTFVIIVGWLLPTLRDQGNKLKGETEAGDVLITIINEPDQLPAMIMKYGKAATGGTLSDPWASSASTTAQQSVPTQVPTVASSPDVPVFTSIRFADGQLRDVCAVRADASGNYTIALLCDEGDKVSNNALSLVGADLSPLAGKLPTATTTQAGTTAQALPSPLLFQQDEEAARCFFVLLSGQTSELKKYGDSLLPAGSQWVLDNTQWTFFIPGKDEEWTLCSVQYPQFGCLQLNGPQAKALGGKGSVVGSGTTFPSQCVPTTNP